LRSRDVALLTSLAAAGQQNDQSIAVATEIKSIARPEIEPSFQNTATDAFHIAQIASESWTSAFVTRARVTASSPSSHRRNGRRPAESR